ncbi:MAG: cytochrome C [Deltaproteobacteria bacterium]|nr:cytochrome C [Deltaproteobacteria bacterium]
MNDTGALSLVSKALLLLFAQFTCALLMAQPGSSQDSPDEAIYAGSPACKSCHEKEYASFTTYAKKSRSYESIERIKKGLNEDDLKKCYSCHTTGYGKEGGFVSADQTPDLKNAGCEVCHGPGSLHIRDQTPESITGAPTIKVCDQCHTGERIKAFRFKPLIHGGAH